MSKPVENFYKSSFEFIWAKLRTLQGSKISNAPEKDSFAISDTHLELGRERREDYMKVGERKVGVASEES